MTSSRFGEFVIRRGVVADAEGLSRLAVSTFAAAYGDLTAEEVERYGREVFSVDRFLGVLERSDALVLLAVGGAGELVGYAQLEATDAPEVVGCSRPVELVRLYLLPEAQGRGLGAALLDAGLRWASGEGYDGCWLRVWEENPRAVSFYRGHGFSVVGREPYGIGGMDDTVLLMRRSLL